MQGKKLHPNFFDARLLFAFVQVCSPYTVVEPKEVQI